MHVSYQCISQSRWVPTGVNCYVIHTCMHVVVIHINEGRQCKVGLEYQQVLHEQRPQTSAYTILRVHVLAPGMHIDLLVAPVLLP
jgi:hypothetical protein